MQVRVTSVLLFKSPMQPYTMEKKTRPKNTKLVGMHPLEVWRSKLKDDDYFELYPRDALLPGREDFGDHAKFSAAWFNNNTPQITGRAMRKAFGPLICMEDGSLDIYVKPDGCDRYFRAHPTWVRAQLFQSVDMLCQDDVRSVAWIDAAYLEFIAWARCITRSEANALLNSANPEEKP